MASLLGFLGAMGDTAMGGSPSYLTRLNDAADPAAAAARAEAKQQLAGQSALANWQQNGGGDINALYTELAKADPKTYAQLQLEGQKIQASNPLASALSNWGKQQQPAAAAPLPWQTGGQAPATPQEDPYTLKPESPDDKRNYDFLNSTVPPQYRSLVRAISNGDESAGNADSIRSNGMLALASNFDPSLSKTNYESRKATAKDFASGGKSGQAITSMNTATKHLAQVALSGLELHNGGFTPWNWVKNETSALFGNDPTTNLKSTVDTVAPELAKAAANGGDTTQSDRQSQAESFGISNSPQQLLGAVVGKADLIQSKAEEIEKTHKKDLGRSTQAITDENKRTLKDLRELHKLSIDGKLDTDAAKLVVDRLKGVAGNAPTPKASGATIKFGDLPK